MRDSNFRELCQQQQLKPGLCCCNQVNGVIEGTDIIYRDYCDISIAVATPKGLVVPVLRDADKLDFAGVERVRWQFHSVFCPVELSRPGELQGIPHWLLYLNSPARVACCIL
jgi:2-oxoacid dehydrogenases acyltransferase (catalytic domain)